MQRESSSEISNFEKILEASLYPIKPNPDFINRLEDRLRHPGDISIDTKRKMSILVVFMFFTVFILLLIWVIRKIIKMLS